MATNADVLEAFGGVRSWTQGEQRAPHKPLLLLMALAALKRGEGRWLAFSEVETKLQTLIEEFGPDRSSVKPQYPFWRLTNDGVWEILGSSPFLPVKAQRRNLHLS